MSRYNWTDWTPSSKTDEQLTREMEGVVSVFKKTLVATGSVAEAERAAGCTMANVESMIGRLESDKKKKREMLADKKQLGLFDSAEEPTKRGNNGDKKSKSAKKGKGKGKKADKL